MRGGPILGPLGKDPGLKRAVDAYIDSSGPFNGPLGSGDYSRLSKHQVENLSRLLSYTSQAKLSRDVVGYRGFKKWINRKDIDEQVGGLFSPDAVGKEFVHKPFTSVGLDIETARSFDTGGLGLARIYLPKGSKATPVDNMEETELLVHPGQRYRVLGHQDGLANILALPGFARGGSVKDLKQDGKGLRRRFFNDPSISPLDRVEALLTPGEFVFARESVARIGVDRLDEMNRTGKIRGFNKGGYVGYAEGGEVQETVRAPYLQLEQRLGEHGISPGLVQQFVSALMSSGKALNAFSTVVVRLSEVVGGRPGQKIISGYTIEGKNEPPSHGPYATPGAITRDDINKFRDEFIYGNKEDEEGFSPFASKRPDALPDSAIGEVRASMYGRYGVSDSLSAEASERAKRLGLKRSGEGYGPLNNLDQAYVRDVVAGRERVEPAGGIEAGILRLIADVRKGAPTKAKSTLAPSTGSFIGGLPPVPPVLTATSAPLPDPSRPPKDFLPVPYVAPMAPGYELGRLPRSASSTPTPSQAFIADLGSRSYPLTSLQGGIPLGDVVGAGRATRTYKVGYQPDVTSLRDRGPYRYTQPAYDVDYGGQPSNVVPGGGYKLAEYVANPVQAETRSRIAGRYRLERSPNRQSPLVSDRLSDVVTSRVRREVSGEGFTGSIDESEQRHRSEVTNQLIQAEATLARSIDSTIFEQDALREAADRVKQAWQDNERVVRDASGRIIGLQSTFKSAREAGIFFPRGGEQAAFERGGGYRLQSLPPNEPTLQERLSEAFLRDRSKQASVPGGLERMTLGGNPRSTIASVYEAKQAALDAISSGDRAAARDQLRRLRSLDPGNTAAAVAEARYRQAFGGAGTYGGVSGQGFASFPLSTLLTTRTGADLANGGFSTQRGHAQRFGDEGARNRNEFSVSEFTANLVEQKRHERITKELVQAESRLIQAINPVVSAHEAVRIATERVRAGWNDNSSVVRGLNGKLLGLQATVDRARASKLDINEVVAGGFFGRFRSGLDAINERVSAFENFREKQAAKITPGRQLAGAVASVGLTFAADRISGFAGDVSTAVNTGRGGQYQALQGTGSALTGAVTGAYLGSYIPGYGTAIGAVLGGLTGLATSLTETSKEIREAKIARELEVLGSRLPRLADGATDATSLIQTRLGIETILRETASKNQGLATGFFTGFDPRQYATLQQESIRQDFGPQLGNLSQYLNRQIEALAKANPERLAKDLFPQLNVGLNGSIIGISRQARGLSQGEISAELIREISRAQQTERSRRLGRDSSLLEESAVNSFTKLISSVQIAADSLGSLRGVAHTLGDLFNGTVTPGRLSVGSEALSRLGTGPTSLEALRLISVLGGENGRGLERTGTAVNNVSTVLPSVLAAVASKPLVQGDDIQTAVRSSLSDALRRNGTFNTDTQSVITSVLRQISEMTDKDGMGDFIARLRNDPSKISEQALSSVAGPVRETGVKFAQLLEQEGQNLIDNLVEFERRGRTLGETIDAGAQSRLSSRRQVAEFAAQRDSTLGTLALSFPKDQANEPYLLRQQRLSGLKGVAALDPEQIARALKNTQTDILIGASRQDEAFRSGKGFVEAATELQNLKSRAVDLELSLRNLTNVTERNADLQERLRAIEGDRQGRLSLTERLTTSGPSERLQLTQGLFNARQSMANPSFFLSLPDARRRQVLDSLQSAGGAILPGFGGRTGVDAREFLLAQTAERIGLGQPNDLKNQRDALQGEVAKNLTDATKAYELIAKNQGDLQASFFRNLQETHSSFLSRLGQALAAEKLTSATNRQGQAGIDLANLNRLGDLKKTLGGIGVTNDDQLNRFKRAFPDVEALSNVRERVNSLKNLGKELATPAGADEAFALMKKEGANPFIDSPQRSAVLAEFLQNRGLDQQSIGSIVPRYQNLVEIVRSKEANSTLKGSREDALRTAFADSIDYGVDKTARSIQTNDGRKVSNRLEAQGFDVNRLQETLDQPKGLETLREAVTKFGESGKGLDGLSGRIEDAKKAFDSLTADVENLRRQIFTDRKNGVPYRNDSVDSLIQSLNPLSGFAKGGAVSPFRPIGSDDIPIMASRGEYIVNAESTRNNYGLLKQINNSKRPLYRANGGPVWDLFSGVDESFSHPSTRVGEIRGQLAEARRRLADREGASNPERWNRRKLALDRIDRETSGYAPGDVLRDPISGTYRGLIEADSEAGESTRLSTGYGFLDRLDAVARKTADALGISRFGAGLSGRGNIGGGFLLPTDEEERKLGREQNRRRRLSDADKQAINIAEAPVSLALSQTALTQKFGRNVLAGMSTVQAAFESTSGNVLAIAKSLRDANDNYASSPQGVAASANDDLIKARMAGLNRVPSRQAQLTSSPARSGAVERLLAESAALRESVEYGKAPTLTPAPVKPVTPEQKAEATRKAVRAMIDKRTAYENERAARFQGKVKEAVKSYDQRQASQQFKSLNGIASTDTLFSLLEQSRGEARRSTVDEITGPPNPLRDVMTQARMRGAALAQAKRERLQEIQARNRRRRGIPSGMGGVGVAPGRGPTRAQVAAGYQANAYNALRLQQLYANPFDHGDAFGIGRADIASQNGYVSDSYRRHAEMRRENALGLFGERDLGVRPQTLKGLFGFDTGGYIPDSLPSYLSEGEYVMSRAAVSRVGPEYLKRLNQGGPVQPQASSSGPGISPQVAQAMSNLTQGFSQFSQSSQTLALSMNQFNGNAAALSEALKNFPRSVSLQGQHTVNINHNAAEVFGKLEPALRDMIVAETEKSIRAAFKEYLPAAGYL